MADPQAASPDFPRVPDAAAVDATASAAAGPATAERAAVGRPSFDAVFDQPDPRAYFRQLAPLDYVIPHHAQSYFRCAAAERAVFDDGVAAPPVVLDLCCSYGINAALLNHDLTLAELYAHYTDPAVEHLTTAELASLDKEFYAERRRDDAVPVIGLDVASRAVHYAQEVGLLDAAHTDDLEHGAPGARLGEALADVGLITLTGCGRYVTRRSFDALMPSVRRPVWVHTFVPRTASYTAIAGALAAHGLSTTADLTRTYPQRLFTGGEEQRCAIAAVRALGGDPAGREGAGRFHAVRYESRPQP